MSKCKLLLADDSVTIQKVVNLTFADEDIEVIAVGDGDTAMQKFTESMPDLVMADVNMPGLDGYRICEMIKQDDETKHIPVILLVGSFEPFDEEEARRVGADDFLTKPFQSIRQLVNKVSDLLIGEKKSAAENEEIIVNSFDDTLEMLPAIGEDESIPVENLGDAGMDDEMIQTSQIGSLPIDETQKFNSTTNFQTAVEEDADFDALKQPDNFRSTTRFDNWDEKQPILKDDEDSSENTSLRRNQYDSEDEEDDYAAEELNAEFEQLLSNNKDVDEIPEDSSFALDDFDLLELPQSKKDSLSGNKRQNNSNDFDDSANLNHLEASVVQSKSSTNVSELNNLSPEAIEAIAEKVVEKISDATIRKIVEAVVTQMKKEK